MHAKQGATEWLYHSVAPAYTKTMPRAYEQISPELRDFVSESLAQS